MPSLTGKSHRGPNISQVTSDKILMLMAHQLGVPSSDPVAIISAAQAHKDQIDWARIGNSCNIQKQLARKHFNEVIKPRYESSGSIMDITDRSEFTMFIASLLSSRCYPSAEVLAKFAPTSGRKYSRVILRRAFHNIKKCRMLKDCYTNLGYTFNDLLLQSSQICEQEQFKIITPSDDVLQPSLFAGTSNKYTGADTDQQDQTCLLQRRDLPLPTGPRAASSSSSSSLLMPKLSLNYPKFMSSSLPSLSTKATYSGSLSSKNPSQSFTVLANLSDSPLPQYSIDSSYNVMRSIPIAPLPQPQSQHPLTADGQQYWVPNPAQAHGSVSSNLLSRGVPGLATTSSLELGLEQDPDYIVTKTDRTPVYGEVHGNTMPIFGDSGGYYSSTFSSWESNDQPAAISSAPSPFSSHSALPCMPAQAAWTKPPPIPVTPNQVVDHFRAASVYSASASASSSASVCSLDFPVHPASLLASGTRTPTQEEMACGTQWTASSGDNGEGGVKSEQMFYSQFTQQNYTELSSVSSDIFSNLPFVKFDTSEGIPEDKEACSSAGIVVNDPFSLNEDPTPSYLSGSRARTKL